MKNRDKNKEWFGSGRDFSSAHFRKQLEQLVQQTAEEKQKEAGVVFLCIGSDRSTGDSLGPLIGYKLQSQTAYCIIGTLKQPVHALNLEKTLNWIERKYRHHVVIAIDASLGGRSQIGQITMGAGALRPGLGVRKSLQEAGDIYITGVVGCQEESAPWTLQNVRLSLVMELADSICRGIRGAELNAE